MNESRNPLLNSATFLAAITGYLFCVSTAYYEGYLGAFKLDASMLDRNFHQVLYQGALIAFAPLFSVFLVCCMLQFFYSFVFLSSLIDWLRKCRNNKRRYIKLKQHLNGKRPDSKNEIFHKNRFKKITIWTGVSVIFLISMLMFQRSGYEDGADSSKTGKPMLNVKINGEDYSLFYLTCGARNCAGLDLRTQKIYYFPQNGHSFQFSKSTK